ncbi:MAG TPA: low molecular weight phosphotyrosine protein phosphatase [Flavobacteriaceae bacterium]|jgi:protein-tyrosine phosphatase|nr:protein-tyrosine-phosphatase [Flavobacteriaceae bacterium]MAY53369.1 protein-tyrosine-phosphatase [Flavobacteriaceae bacterium]HBR54084.1 protein-tyrosine-phosphatase [Flavobacteriaceae bacterium]HIB48369.1 low molecular weight phosphotyrosine protein phosphatase [Flavobacteriaceae bacterium]HIO00030.1 low molecular weight phosphotyrosine protein phosphatase [Flavobacteriaceae bacterium]|tara:strand:- start:36731 stop:37180 length:450 start_codon:yes stop_codon:yes gene_type:complete
MKKILMVCLGNICRSPLAEGLLKSKVDPSKVEVQSAGTGGWHVGELPDPRSIEIANKYGLDITNQRGKQFSTYDFEIYDHIFVMDNSNYRDVMKLATNPYEEQKVHLILEETHPGEKRDVPDPYHGGDEGFENVYQLLDAACEKIAARL